MSPRASITGFICIFLVLLLPDVCDAQPYPSVPGEILVQVRIPGVSRAKGRNPAYQLPPMIEKELEGVGLISSDPLFEPIQSKGVGPKTTGGFDGDRGVFHLKFKGVDSVEDLVKKAEALPGIVFAEPNYIGSLAMAAPDEFYSTDQKAVYDLINLEEAWEVTTGSMDVRVAVLDSGIDLTHPEFESRVLPGWNFVEDNDNVQDRIGHGTRVSGIIGAKGGESGPGSGMAGICWEVGLIPVVVSAPNGEITAATVAQAIDWAWRQGAGVINMSLVIGGDSRVLEYACNVASVEAVLVAAAGNDGQNLVPRYPAGYDSVISVGSIESATPIRRASFSNYNLPGVNDFVDIVAPGADIYSTIPDGKHNGSNGRGTSFSAPIVSGITALLRSLRPEQSTRAIRTHLERHVTPVGNFVSHGLIDAAEAISQEMVPILRVASIEIFDGTALNSNNDADAAVDIGETAQMIIELENEGADLPSLNAVLVSTTPNVTVEEGTARFPILLHGQRSKNLTTPFKIDVSQGISQSMAPIHLAFPEIDPVTFELTIENESTVPQFVVSDLTLGPEDTWIISGLTKVATGATLTILPGATVKFHKDSQLRIEGGLQSVGTQSEPINWKMKTLHTATLSFAKTYDIGFGLFPVGEPSINDFTADGLLDIVLPTEGYYDPSCSCYRNGGISFVQSDDLAGYLPPVTLEEGRPDEGTTPTRVTSDDFNDDGLLDLLAVYYHSNQIGVLLNEGNGTFSPAHFIKSVTNPTTAIPEDINGDGKLDVLLLTENGQVDIISAFIGNGFGEFPSKIDYIFGNQPTALSLTDLTGDGHKDLIALNRGSADLSLLPGSATGGFLTEYRIPLAGLPTTMLLADVNNDAATDLICTTQNSSGISIVLADQGTGSFLPGTVVPIGLNLSSITLAEINGDAYPDLMALTYSALVDSSQIHILRGLGDGSFPSDEVIEIGGHTSSLQVIDANLDGFKDLITLGRTSIGFYAGTKGGQFLSEKTYIITESLDGEIRYSRIGDFNGDQLLDVAVPIITEDRGGSREVAVLLGNRFTGFDQPFPVRFQDIFDRIEIADVDSDGSDDLLAFHSPLDGGGPDQPLRASITKGSDRVGFPTAPFIHETFDVSPIKETLFADVNNDGINDIVTVHASTHGGNAYCRIRQGTPYGPSPHSASLELANDPTNVLFEDVNQDGILDLVTGGLSGFRPSVNVNLGLPGLAFSQRIVSTSDSWFVGPDKILVSDWNMDGHKDILALGDQLLFLEGDSSGQFEVKEETSLPFFLNTEALLADLDNDGLDDLIVLAGGGVETYLGNTEGKLEKVTEYYGGWSSYHMEVGDVNGDGVQDVVVDDSFLLEGSYLHVLLGAGDGRFSTQLTLSSGTEAWKFKLADINGDRAQEILTMIRGTVPAGRPASEMIGNGTLVVNIFNRDTQTFDTLQCPVGHAPISFDIGDINDDGISDFVVENLDSDDLSLGVGTDATPFFPEIRIPLSYNLQDRLNGPRISPLLDESPGIAIEDVNGDQHLDIVISDSIGQRSTVITLLGDGAGGTGGKAPILEGNSGDIVIDHSKFDLDSSISISEGGVVTMSTFRNSGGPGLVCKGDVIVSDCTSVNCSGMGFIFQDCKESPFRVRSVSTRGAGIFCDGCVECEAIGNADYGVLSSGPLSDCRSLENREGGIFALDVVEGAFSGQNNESGIISPRVLGSTVVRNQDTGIIAAAEVRNCTAIANGDGILSPVIIDSLIIDTFDSALAGASSVNGSQIFGNNRIGSFGVSFNNTVIANNGEEPELTEISDMYIAGNAGGGVDGIPVYYSTIIGNKGQGVANSSDVFGSNIVFNEGPGVLNSTVSNSYLKGNRGGDIVGSASSNISFTEPRTEAPAFLEAVHPTEEFPLGIGAAGFEFTWSTDMNTNRKPEVSFAQTEPYTTYILAASPGWTSDRTWRGSFVINDEVPDGTHTFRVARAVTAQDPPFLIPPDTYHRFRVDKQGGLQLSNGRVVSQTLDSLTLEWDPSPTGDIFGSRVVRSSIAAGPYLPVGEVVSDATTFLDQSGLEPNTTYFYQIYEFDSKFNNRQLTGPFSGKTAALLADANALLDLLRSGNDDYMTYFDFAQYWMDSLPSQ